MKCPRSHSVKKLPHYTFSTASRYLASNLQSSPRNRKSLPLWLSKSLATISFLLRINWCRTAMWSWLNPLSDRVWKSLMLVSFCLTALTTRSKIISAEIWTWSRVPPYLVQKDSNFGIFGPDFSWSNANLHKSTTARKKILMSYILSMANIRAHFFASKHLTKKLTINYAGR